MLAKNQRSGPTRISVRYYLWSSDGLQRITERLHRELFDRHVAITKFSDTKQKVLEVLVQRLTKIDYRISARGVVYPFDADGFLDVKTLALEGSLEISRFRSGQENVLDLNPSVKRRRFKEQYTWKPSKAILNDVWKDIDLAGHRRLPVLRPLNSRE